jgi:hypothetical protein
MTQTMTQTMTQKMTRILSMVAMLVLSLATPPLAAQPCEPGWAEGFAFWGIDGIVRAQAVFDDGHGPALYVGGEFTDAAGVPVNGIARLDGRRWSTVAGPDGLGLSEDVFPFPVVVYALTVFDDGTGPALYAAGEFSTAGGVTVNNIARWDGSVWSPLTAPGGTGVAKFGFPASVYALTVFDDGTGPALYAGGDFATTGGVTVNYVARWDGSTWSALTGPAGTGVNGEVYTLMVFDEGSGPALYAGGIFTTAGGVFVNRVARWDGTDWSPLAGPSATGVNGEIRALTVFDDGTGPALYAGGTFTTAGGVALSRIARWDGSVWSPLTGPTGAMGVNNRVNALTVFDDGAGPALYAGGTFTTDGGVALSHIARWDGSVWSPLPGPRGTGVNGEVNALIAFDNGTGPALYAGGEFTTAGGLKAYNIAKWDGTALSPLFLPSSAGMNATVNELTVFDDGSGPALYAGGSFTTAGGVSAHRIARWDGVAWSTMTGFPATGVSSAVFAMTVFDDGTGPALYAGGQFRTAGDVTVNRIAKWDGSAWSPLTGPSGTGVADWVHDLSVYNDGTGPALYAGGEFTTAGGVPVNRMAEWDGSAWSSLSGLTGGTGVYDEVRAFTVFDDGTNPALFAGGSFLTAGGVTVNHIAKWDGSAWSPLTGPAGTGFTGKVYTLTVFDDGTGPALYAGGNFTTAGGVTVNRIAKWDGNAWSPLTGPSGTGVDHTVLALTVFDDGTGPALYAGGHFTTAGGVTVNRIAKWDGIKWSPLTGPSGTGVSNWVGALTVFDDGTGPALFVGGGFTTAGGVPSEYIAKWTSCPPNPSCNPADLAEPFDTLDLADIVAFVTAFGNLAPDADLAEPFGLFDLADLLAFVTAFGAGCP